MKVCFRLLYPLVIATILAACSPGAVKTVPVVYITATPPEMNEASPRPSDTATLTAIPDTSTPSPSATVPLATATETQQYAPTPDLICNPAEFDNFLEEWDRPLTQLILLSREVGQLEELPDNRAEEILAETIKIEETINELSVPTCLEYAHQKTTNAISLLRNSINLVLAEDIEEARIMLYETFEEIVRVTMYAGYMVAEITATSQPFEPVR
jgi:hypothetical protein